MTTLTLRDGTELYYKDWGSGPVVLFSHGWPLSSDMWEHQMLALSSQGYRTVAFDRRGFGRSRVAKLALISAVTPLFMKTEDHPVGPDRALFDGIRAGLNADRAQFLDDFSTIFYGTNRPGAKVSAGVFKQTLQIALQASLKGTIECVTAFSETDFRDEMRKIDVPTLVIHGDDDQVVPIEATGRLTAEIVEGAKLIVYPGASHATCLTHKDQVSADLLAFLRG